ncbi:MAG: hypothetical protein ACI4CA_04585, partial [Bacteroides sp.]
VILLTLLISKRYIPYTDFLKQFLTENASRHAYRLSMNDFRQESWLTNLPLYAAERILSIDCPVH